MNTNKKKKCLLNNKVSLYGLKEPFRLFYKDLTCGLRRYGYYKIKTGNAFSTPIFMEQVDVCTIVGYH
jgi:hypothetical protein